MNGSFIINALKNKYPEKDYGFFVELRIGGGFSKDSEQRFDAWSISYFPSKRNVTTCFEVKISKSDFMHEIKNPKKRRAGLRLANEFYFVTPEGLLEITDIPPECGLLEVTEGGLIRTTIHAPFRDIEPPTWLFLSSICRRTIAEEYVREANQAYWSNLTLIFKQKVMQILNRSSFEWKHKGNEVTEKAIDKVALEVVDINIQDLIHKSPPKS